MNKLIQEIAYQYENLDTERGYYGITDYEGFAKAIIKECIQSVGGFQKTTPYRRKMILDHFGLTDKDIGK